MDIKEIRPFPGLRPFEEDEEHLFFGREKSVSELLSRLRTSRFLGVIGTSGSGKSSLVKSGLLPALYRGFMAGAGSRWKTALFRPGENPVGNLAEALAATGIVGGGPGIDEEIADMGAIYGKFIETTLRRSSRGLVDVIEQSRLGTNESLLIVVDQFEELFRFNRLERASKKDGKRDSVVFINMLLESARQAEVPIYIIITMRSDFLGDCTEFRDLPEAINDGQYLIPRMTRDEKRAAVTGPAAVAGAKMSRALLSRVLNDAGDNPDQLPILQHALMRTWDYWLEHRKENEPLGIEHYEAIGTMRRALSPHAEEALGELKTGRSRTIYEKMFKLITHMEETGRGVRRPARISEICRVAEASEKEVIEIVEVFRKPGRTFLMPPHGVALEKNSVIDISHESFMRIWGRLIAWVDEESRSAELYIRLAKAAALYEEGKAALWRDPELMLALNWREENKPNSAWAERYDPSFERANHFLDASKKQKELAIAEKERAQKAKIKRTRIFSAVISIAAVLALALAIWAFNSQKEAHRQKAIAIEEQQKARASEKEAKEQKAKAEEKEKEANEQKVKAVEKEKEAREARGLAEKNERQANQNEKRAKIAETNAKKNEKRAKQSAVLEEIQGLIVDMNKEEAGFRQFLAKAQELAVHSIAQKDNNELKALLALTAYKMNETAYTNLEASTQKIFAGFDKNKSNEFRDNEEIAGEYKKSENVYNRLRQVARNKRQPAKIFEALRGAYIAGEESRDIIYPDVETWALTVEGDNRIIFNHREGRLLSARLGPAPGSALPVINEKNIVKLSGSILQACSFAHTPDRLFCGSLDGGLFLWQKNNWEKSRRLGKHNAKILTMVFSRKKNRIFYSVGNGIYMNPLNSKETSKTVLLLEEQNYIRAMVLVEAPGSGGPFLIAGDEKGDLFRVDISGGIEKMEKEKINTTLKPTGAGLYAAAFEPRGHMLALAGSGGKIHLLTGIDCKNLASGTQIPHVTFETGHRGIVKVLAFSPGGKFLASGGMDGSVMLRDLQKRNSSDIASEPPVLVIKGKKKILSLVFDPGGEYIIFNDEQDLRLCPTRPEVYYDHLCKRKGKAFSPAAWKQYVGESIKPGDINICSPTKEK